MELVGKRTVLDAGADPTPPPSLPGASMDTVRWRLDTSRVELI